MASSGNFCTLNPRQKMSAGTFSNGNTKYASTGDDGYRSTMAMTNKTYCEVRIDALSNYGGTLGFTSGNGANYYGDAVTFQCNASSGVIYHYKGTSSQSVSIANIGGTVSAGSIVMMAFDPATYKWWVGVNGTWRNSGDPANGTGFVFEGSSTMFEDMSDFFWGGWKGGANGFTGTYNFGQDSTFGGQETAGGNADGNGFGDFKYSVPTGFLANCSGNIVISDDIDPAQTDTNYPAKNFNIVKYTGTGSSQAITGLGFKPDLIWIKQRNGSGHNVLTDSTRGVTKQLEITDTEGDTGPAESTNTDGVTAIGTDGFTVGGDAEYSGNTNTYVAWCWRAGEGTTATNTDGTVASTVQANTAAGFSIVSYTGTGSAMTIGHGLSSAPNFTIIKDRSNATNWIAFYDVEDGSLDYMFPNAYTGKANSGLTGPNSSIWNFSASDSYSNTSSRNYIMYAWHNVEGYQRFGTYEGNNIDNNGPFVYTGFRPRLLVIKGIDESYGWYVFDSERSTSNLVDDMVSWFPGGSETSEPTGARKVDFLSNGFKVMADAASINGASDTYLYMAWGDTPFKYNNTF